MKVPDCPGIFYDRDDIQREMVEHTLVLGLLSSLLCFYDWGSNGSSSAWETNIWLRDDWSVWQSDFSGGFW